MENGLDEVMKHTKALNESSQKTSATTTEGTKTISAATEEQSASMEEIASASTHLSNMAEDLQAAIQKFKV